MTDAKIASLQAGDRVPLWLKLVYTAFMAVLVPVYWHYYGPTNFLYFCDLALFITLVGISIEKSFLISMCAVGILAPQAVWFADFVSNIVGSSLIGITDYMFNHENSIVSTRAVAIPRLVAILASLSRLGTGVPPTRIAGVDPSRLGAAASVFLLHAAT